LKPGEPLPDHLEIVVVGSNNHPGNFVLRSGIDNAPIGLVTTAGKSAAVATDLTLETEIPKMFGRMPRRGDTLSGAFVGDIRAAGFDVLFAPTSHNPFHVRIVAKTHTFDTAGRETLALALGAALLEQWLGNRLRAISRCNSRASVVEMGYRNPV